MTTIICIENGLKLRWDSNAGVAMLLGHQSTNIRTQTSTASDLNDQKGLTQTVVSIVGQHEAIVAGTPVVSRDVDAFMDASAVVVILTFIHVWKVAKVKVISPDLVWAAECSQHLPGYILHSWFYICQCVGKKKKVVPSLTS